MGCACNKRKTTYQVVLPTGKIALNTPSKAVADQTAARYPDAEVKTISPAAKTTPAKATSAKAPAPAKP